MPLGVPWDEGRAGGNLTEGVNRSPQGFGVVSFNPSDDRDRALSAFHSELEDRFSAWPNEVSETFVETVRKDVKADVQDDMGDDNSSWNDGKGVETLHLHGRDALEGAGSGEEVIVAPVVRVGR